MRREALDVIGRRYLLRGQRVTIRARWLGNHCPRNVLLELPDGTLTVRPFRGLRRLDDEDRQPFIVSVPRGKHLDDTEDLAGADRDRVAGPPVRDRELSVATNGAVGVDKPEPEHRPGGYP